MNLNIKSEEKFKILFVIISKSALCHRIILLGFDLQQKLIQQKQLAQPHDH